MNINSNPALLDQLAASWALGTLRGGARRRFEALARESVTVRAAALIWQERFAGLTELQAADAPSPNVWKRIEIQLAAQRARPLASGAAAQGDVMVKSLQKLLGLWRGAALAGALASVAAIGVAINLGRDQQAIEYVAVLADDRAAPSVLVTFDPKRKLLTLKRVGGYQEASDKSLQLWALPPAAGQLPRSLGVLGSDRVIRLSAQEAAVRGAPALAISLEPKGGVSGERGPTGPVLFSGAVVDASI